MRHLYTPICIAVLFIFTSSAGADVILNWNNVALNTIRNGNISPPQGSRMMAMMHAAVFDAVNSVDHSYSAYKIDTTAPLGTSREAAAATAAHDVLTSLYPSYSSTYNAALALSLSAVPDGQSKQDGVALGQYVANGIVNWRATDGSSNNVPYTPGTEPGEWRPTPPGYASALLPGWGQVTPFAMTDGSQYRISGPPALDSLEYAQDVNETKTLGEVNSLVRTSDQTEIANFWAGGKGTDTPPGHWNQIAQVVSVSENNTLIQNARMFALLNISLADAAIAAWDCKYQFNLWRPITAIQEADLDGNPLTTADPNWVPLIVTPPFPECVSGHSAFSGAAAEALARFFGTDDIAFIVGSDDLPGVYRSYDCFSEAAIESGRSRIYGGIHFEFSDMSAVDMGSNIGNYAYDNYMQPAVPEWSSLWLAGSGVLSFTMLKRRPSNRRSVRKR